MRATIIRTFSAREQAWLIEQIFVFKNALLHQYVMKKGRITKTLFRLREILLVLKRTISDEGLYDVNNPVIILCDAELEEALNIKAFHDDELIGVLVKHLAKIDNNGFVSRYFREDLSLLPEQETSNPIRPPVAIYAHNFPGSIRLRKDMNFTCKSKFLQVLRSLPEVEENKTVFTLEEILKSLTAYLLRSREKFFDPRNTLVALVKGDPLGEALGMNAFHKTQVNNLLRGQLYIHGSHPDPSTASISASGAGQNNRVVAIPSPGGSRGSVVLRIPAFPGVRRTRSDQEQVRPSFAGGISARIPIQGQSDSDSDINETFDFQPYIKGADSEINYWADRSGDEKSPAETKDDSKIEDGHYCKECGDLSYHRLRYCIPCWRIRKDWLGAYFKKERRRAPRGKGVSLESVAVKKEKDDNVPELANPCHLCCNENINAGIIHGKISHQFCCYSCAKKIWQRGSECPVCRRKISKIVKIAKG